MNTIQILMSTYNGEKYIREQIESLINQVGVNVRILVRDDGSTDNTIGILEEYKNLGVLDYYSGKNLKPAKSFMNLIYNAPEVDYYAFCDQDDYWLPEKLYRAIEKMQNKHDKPELYFSKAQLVDSELNVIKYKSYPDEVYSFAHALIKNNATGCTMVFNKALFNVVRSSNPMFISMHDYWIYLTCLSIDGDIFYDNNSYIKYRQHENNVVGGRKNIIDEYSNKFKMLLNKEKTRHKIAVELKNCYFDYMNKNNKEVIDLIVNYPNSYKNKMNLITDTRFKTKSLKNNILFSIAIIFDAF